LKINHLLQLGFGVATFIPGVPKSRGKGTGGTDTARYCYSVWLRHLSKCRDQGLWDFPQVVAELGPGDSLGLGFAALLSGADQYYAFDVVEYANNEKNLEIFDELLDLFQQRADIPDDVEFPSVHPSLESYDFPADVLSEDHLNRALSKQRIERLRSSVVNAEVPNSVIKYIVPWAGPNTLNRESVDMIFSQAVLEHVDQLEATYQAMRAWLRPTGFMSHEIDFKSHGTADEWNGHWTYSDLRWKLMRGRRPYLINRQPYSVHLGLLKKTGFNVILDCPKRSDSNTDKKDLAPRFQDLSNDDLAISVAFIVAVPDGHQLAK
jgi:methyltransferase family protein